MAKKIMPAVNAEVSTQIVSLTPVRIAVRFGAVASLGLLLANCAGQPQGGSYSSQQRREFGAFSHSKYGSASPRMYADTGAALPKGGGRDHIGKAYSVAGRRYVPHDRPVGSSQIGMASWYGAAFHGRKTANGEIYDRRSFSAAHPTMPLPSYARVTNLRNNYSVIVRVNDRGPYHGGRIMDVSERVADTLAFKGQGTGRIRVDYLGRAGIGGSDDVRLAQSLTMDGRPAVASYIPASFGENRSNTQVAYSEPAAPAAAPVQTAAVTPRAAPVAVQAAAPVAAPAAAPAATPAVAAAPKVAAPAAAAPVQPAPAKAATAGEPSTGRSAAVAAAAAIAQKNESRSQKAEAKAPKGEARSMQALSPGRGPLPPGRPVNLGPIPASSPAKVNVDTLSSAPQKGQTKFQQGAALTKTATKKPAKIAALD
jgi:rare lipoprotein A